MATTKVTCYHSKFITLWHFHRPQNYIRKRDFRMNATLLRNIASQHSNTTLPQAFHTTHQSFRFSTVTATSPLNTGSTIKKSVRKKPKIAWTPEADAKLLSLRVEDHKTWLEIGQALDREPATCMTRFESSLNPELQGFWTPERVSILEKLAESAKPWSDIGQTLGCHRLACMEKWRLLGDVGTSSSGLAENASCGTIGISQPRVSRPKVKKGKEKTNDTEQPRRPLAILKSVDPVDKDVDGLSWNSLLVDERRYHRYRVWKKSSQEDSFSPLYLMNPGWSAKEETILIQHVLQNGLDDWEQVASERLHGRFTAAECRTCWKNLDMPVATFLQDDPNRPIPEGAQREHAASALSTSSTTAILLQDIIGQSASGVALTSDSGTGVLTKEQQSQFWCLWQTHGQNWARISELLGVVSPDDCRSYFTTIAKNFKGSEQEVQEKILKLAAAITSTVTPVSNVESAFVTAGESPHQSSKLQARKPAFAWDKELSVRLQAVVRQAYKSRAIHIDEINWLWVSRRVHPDATSRVCKNHWKYLHDDNQVSWRHDDLKRLEEGIRLLGPKKLSAIRDHFLPHMTKDDVTRHWFRISDKATQINIEEYYTLHQAVKEYGEDQWAAVEKTMISASPGWRKLPCKRVWESSYQYLTTHGSVWTPTMDSALLRLVKFVGRDDWYSVAKALQSDKSAWQCRLRWCHLLDPVRLDSNNLTVGGNFYF
ncbi:hypothetical protein BGZ74_005273 [Mortierella antarctica]|nr:hypothetical protein BGZ74_005273 [Mortierella antarctica]